MRIVVLLYGLHKGDSIKGGNILGLFKGIPAILEGMDTKLDDIQQDFAEEGTKDYKTMNLDGSGAYDLFQVQEDVVVLYLWGHVTEAIPNNTTAVSLQLFPVGGPPVQLTNVAGENISNFAVYSMLIKDQPAMANIHALNSSTGWVADAAGLSFLPFAVGQKFGVDTFIRFVATELGASVAIHWHIKWKTMTEDGGLITPV